MPAEGRGGGKREAYDSENISENSDRYEHGEGTADSSRWTPLAGLGNRDETVDWDEVFRTIDHQTSWPSQQPQDHQVPQNLAPWGPAHARNNRPVVSILHNAADRQTGQVHPGPHQIRRSTLELALALEGGPGEIERYIWSNSPQLPSIPPQQPSHSPCPSEQAGPRRSQSFPSYGPEDPSPFTLLASTGAVYNDFDQRSPEALRQRPPPNLHGSGNPPFQEHRPTAGPSRLPPLYTPPPLDVTTPSSYDGAFLDWEPSPFGTTPMVSSAHHDPSPAIGAIGFGQPLPPQPYLPTGSSSRSAHLGSRVDSVPSTPVSSTPRSSSGMPPPPTRAPLGRHQSAGQANQSTALNHQSSQNPSPAQTPASNPTSGEDSEDKRIRNTVASAKFRAKKKEQVALVSRTIVELEERQATLQADVASLRHENGLLKEMVQLKFGTKMPDD